MGAKSLRSKWKRKMRAEKRVNYGERENKKLVKMIEAAEELKKENLLGNKVVLNSKGQDGVMGEDKIELELANTLANTNKKFVDPDTMETNEKAKSVSTKSLKDEHGNYPVWMSMRRVQKQQKKNKTMASAAKSAK